MATSLAASLQLVLKTNYGTTNAHASTVTDVLTKSITDGLTDGDGLDLAECVWSDSFAANPAGVIYDVFGGITDVYGNVLSMKHIKGLLIINTSVVSGEYIDVFGSGAGLTCKYMTGDTDEVRVFPGGILFMWSPGAGATSDSPVAGAGTFDEIKITAAGGTAPVIEMIIIGTNN